MLEKLKNFAESCKTVILYILLPISFVVGYVYYLLSKNKKLEEKLYEKDAEEELKTLEGQGKEIDQRAKEALEKFQKDKEEYERSK